MVKNILIGAVIPLLLVATGIGVLIGLKAPPPPQTPLPRPVPEELLPYLTQVDVDQVRDLNELSESLDLHAHGTVVPYRELEIGAEVSGKIIEKAPQLRSGNYVRRGQLLYRIDPSDYELEVERLTRRLAQAKASLDELEQDILNTRSLLEVAEQDLALAEQELARLEKIEAGFSSAAELDQARRSRLSALNQVVTLKNQVRTLETRRVRAQLDLQLAQTEMRQAQLNLQRTVVRSPVDARVVTEHVEVDSYVQRGTPLIVLEDTSKAEIACNLRMDQLVWVLDQPIESAEELISPVQAMQFELPPTPVEIEFRIGGREDQVVRWNGVIDRFDGAGLDPQSRTVPIRIRVDEPLHATDGSGQMIDASVLPMLVRGMFVDLIIKTQPRKRLLLVPKLSIKPSMDHYVIWKFAPNDQAIYATPIAKQAMQSQDEAGHGAAANSPSESAETGPGKKTVNPAEWQPGFLQVVSDVRLISEFQHDAYAGRYWVCEVPNNQLHPGDLVITSPVPGVKADGTDPVRVARQAMEQFKNIPRAVARQSPTEKVQ